MSALSAIEAIVDGDHRGVTSDDVARSGAEECSAAVPQQELDLVWPARPSGAAARHVVQGQLVESPGESVLDTPIRSRDLPRRASAAGGQKAGPEPLASRFRPEAHASAWSHRAEHAGVMPGFRPADAERAPRGHAEAGLRFPTDGQAPAPSRQCPLAPQRVAPGRPAPVRLTRRGRIVAATAVVIVLAALALAVLLLVIPGGAQAANHGRSGAGYQGMHQIVVQPGQTLWSIALAAEPTARTAAVVQEIMMANAMTSTNVLAGQLLWVPR